MDLEDVLGDRRRRRRLLLLLLLLLLVVVGAGVGGFVPGFGTDDGPSLSVEGTPTPTPPGATPTTTPTRTPTTTQAPAGTATTTASPTSPASPTPTTTAPPTASPSPTTTVAPTPTPSPATPATTATPPPTTTEPGTPPPTTTPPGGGDDPVELAFDGDSVILDYAGVAPGESGSATVVLSNDGTAPGNLSVADITAVDEENGIVDAEATVDDSPTQGELSQHLRLAITITYPNGTAVALYGTGDGPRPVAELAAIDDRSASGTLPADSQATVTVTWLLPAATGNEVQSDAVAVDVTFELRAPES